jgi:hypothetical protein
MTEESSSPERRRQGDSEPWRIEKSISLPQIVMLTIQVATFVWFAATMNAATEDNTRRIAVQEDFQKNAILGPNGLTERMTRLEEQAKSSQKSLDRIETILATPQDNSGHRK